MKEEFTFYKNEEEKYVADVKNSYGNTHQNLEIITNNEVGDIENLKDYLERNSKNQKLAYLEIDKDSNTIVRVGNFGLEEEEVSL